MSKATAFGLFPALQQLRLICWIFANSGCKQFYNRACNKEQPVSVFDEYESEIEHYQTMLGRERGMLAIALDRLTAAAVLVGQHAVYCPSGRDPDLPSMDIRRITSELRGAKELIQAVMEKLRQQSAADGTPEPGMPLI